MSRTPVYFVSHGGPNVMFETEHPAYLQLQKIGREITQKVRPRAVVVFSAHWQAGRDKVEVNEAEVTNLIYDYYGFPDHYYKVQYPNVGSKDLAQKVLGLLKNAGIEAEGVKRGLDHGVFAPFTCMFRPDENPLGVPLVQVSLFGNEDPDKHYALGAALQSLRDENILIVGSGMAVHNLRDMRIAMMSGQEMPYAKVFDKELKKAVTETSTAEERKKAMRELLWHKSARPAHPTFEHLLPVHIAAGAAGEDKAKQLFTFTEMSFSWAQYRFGDIPAASAAEVKA
ncbi:Extradiol ring-cleavage dioxygenase, class III enzyme, subunit B [Sphaerosporella brunnea]|uniref:Extradiol ring-cleavage dioxygenase, class III enzyme, subunit B n=1 Tax=Sphaerosporella brunnea TaxID=1250544 RepID=A0A5J5ED78_9PEZI|nr:Extradiol ring-cleavage dioxygenase, class III enzyme, subunit B [Sphaerosporella brunnea]